MPLMMYFSNKEDACRKNEAIMAGFDYYHSDNIYRFLKIAKEVRPDVVMMHFADDFNTDSLMMKELKNALCEKDVCPKIYLNKPNDYEGEIFFEYFDFSKASGIIDKIKKDEHLLH